MTDTPRALLVGLGVVGLPLARRLSQAGWELLLCDPDQVERGNLTKQLFDDDQVKLLKVDAAARLLRRHSPHAGVTLLPWDVRTLGAGVFRGVDLVLVGVDNRAAERHCATLAARTGRPMVRLATSGAERGVALTFIPAPCGPRDPCGICTFTADDHRLASLRASCVDQSEVNPNAGELTFAEHGSLAAALTADAILNHELAPARLVQFTSGTAPSCDTTRILRSPGCLLGAEGLEHEHQALEWDALEVEPDDFTLGLLLEQAAARLGSSPGRLRFEADLPLCTIRYCKACGALDDAGFARYQPGGPRCRCQGAINQFDYAQLAPWAAHVCDLWPRTMQQLGAPLEPGFRLCDERGQRWNVTLQQKKPPKGDRQQEDAA